MKQHRNRTPWGKHQKRWFGKWHLYLGIIAGLIVAVVGITGSILVFRDEIDSALNPSLFHALKAQRRLPLQEVMPLVERRYPQLQYHYIYAPDKSPTSTYQLYNYKTGEQYFINPYTGETCGKRLFESGFVETVTDIHRTLLIPVAGRYIVGLSSLVLLILTITGLRLWIPGKWQHLKAVLTVNFKAGAKRQNYDWHNVVGFYTAPVVSLLSLTGFCITFSILVIPLLFTLSGKPPQGAAQLLGAKSVYTPHAQRLPLRSVVAIAAREMPGSTVAGVALPADSTGNFRLDMKTAGLPRTGKREMLIVDQYSGKILLNSRRDFPGVANAYLSWLSPIHFGDFGGLPTQVLAIIGGLAPAVLFVTGFIIWYPRWKKQRNKKQPVVAAAGVFTGEYLQEAEEDSTLLLRKHRQQTAAPVTAAQPVWHYFGYSLKKGLIYGGWCIVTGAVMGALYGVVSGIVVQPAVFTIAFCCTLVVANYLVALPCFLFHLLFLVPFKKGSRRLIRYFALSSGMLVVFVAAYCLLLNTGMKIF
jgi:uncharacterized iron-regulated membrane protein